MPRLKHWVFDWAETIVVALVLALVIRAFFLQVFWIPSGSMEPTLDINDRIVVNKVIYHFRSPRRFEIIVFRGPEHSIEKKDLIKRLIGLPGETLLIKDNVISINGQPLVETHTMNPQYNYANLGPVTIPADSFFVMGDNRPASFDGRFWKDDEGKVLLLPKKDLIGPAFLRIWPLFKSGLI